MHAAKPRSALMRVVDSDVEDEFSDFTVAIKPRVAPTTAMPPKKARGRPAGSTNKVTKPAQKSTLRRTSGRLAASVADEIQGTSQASPERSNPQTGRERRKDVTDTAPNPDERPKPMRGRPRATKRAEKPADIGYEDEDTIASNTEPKPPVPQPRRRLCRKPTAAKADISATQVPEEMDMDGGKEEIDELEESLPESSASDNSHASARGTIPSSDRGQPAVDMGTSDSSLRRRLGELTKKHETLEAKYRQLQDVGTREAERNFDRFKKQADERAQTSKELIAELKAELAAQASLAKEGTMLEKKIGNHESTIASLQQKITELTTSLSSAKAENKTLSTRLAASRSAEAALAKAPGSAVKVNGPGMRNGANSDVIQAAQMKEDLYTDLTGLIVRGVKTDDKEDVYDCLQTGKNGTLHFKLLIETDISGDGFEEAQVTYQPQLNPSRDRDLIDMLPDYLVEDITFPRPQAANFFSRVTKALME